MKKKYKQKAILVSFVILISTLTIENSLSYANGSRDDDYYHVNLVGNLFNQNQFVTSHTTIPEKICRSNHPHPRLTHAHIQGLDSIKKKGLQAAM